VSVPASPPADNHAAAARLAGLLESAMDAIISIDAEQRILLYNRAAESIFGYPARQVMGHRLDMLLPERFRAGHAGLVARFGQTGVTSRRMGGRSVVVGLRANGEEFPMDASISQLKTDEGTIYTVILRDVTERVRAQEELASFAAEANDVREQEKSRIARELHDELAQSLTALKMDTIWVRQRMAADPAGAAAKLAQMLAMLDECVAATRRIAADLRPLVLDDLGLVPAIEWAVQNFTQRTGVPCDLDVDETLELAEPYATAVFRIVQESLANVGKHACATRARVRVARSGGDLVLEVRDDGVGFRTAAARKPQSLGLVGLRERAHLVKGQVNVESAPGSGTVVRARIPLAPGGTA
jgi:PAS domain S-box-containing protein